MAKISCRKYGWCVNVMGQDRELGLPDFGFPGEYNIANNPILRIIKAIIEEEKFLRQSTLEEANG
jgi:hypothetical protein